MNERASAAPSRKPPPERSDAELLRKAAGGGRDGENAFEEFYRRHHGLVYAASVGIVRRPDLAEDVVQETFLEAHRALRKLGDVRNLRGWLYRAAEHNALDLLRRAKARPDTRGDSSPLTLGTIVDRKPIPSSDAEGSALRDRVVGILAGLPDAQRSAAVLCLLDERTSAEAAAILDTTEGAVRINLHYARLKLRAALGEFR